MAANAEVVGREWDDGFYTGIRKIILTYSDEAIGSFQVFYYDLNGQEIVGNNHDAAGFPNKEEIQLFAGESIVQVTGHTGRIENIKVVRSLKFLTNLKRELGPYGSKDGTPFNLPVEGGRKVVGFKGVTDKFLSTIGVHSTT